jgi:hypothetical protein
VHSACPLADKLLRSVSLSSLPFSPFGKAPSKQEAGMADLYPVAGAKFFIGTVAMSVPTEDVELDDFAGITWLRVSDWQNMGAVGDSAALISTDIIDRGRTVKQKGTRNAGSMQNNFAVNADDPGQLKLIEAANGNSNWPFCIQFDDEPPAASHTATITVASPGVVTWAGNPLEVGDKVVLTTTGALPTGLTAGTEYYVKAKPDADTFTLAATPDGTVINTSSTQSGTHTATTIPNGTEKYFLGLVMGAQEQGGGANTARLLQATVEINTNIVTVAPSAAG